jgi:hypothetical protein
MSHESLSEVSVECQALQKFWHNLAKAEAASCQSRGKKLPRPWHQTEKYDAGRTPISRKLQIIKKE